MSPRIRADRSGGESGGDSYLASVSDLMAGLVFIFIITLAVFALRLAMTNEDAKAAEEETRVQLESIRSARKNRTTLLNALKDQLTELGIEVKVMEDQGVLRLGENGIGFETGRFHPISGHEARVGKLAYALAQVLPCFVDHEDRTENQNPSSRPRYCLADLHDEEHMCLVRPDPGSPRVDTVLVEGHTDSLRVNCRSCKFSDNLELSTMRAAEIWRMSAACEPSLEGLMNRDQLRVVSVSGYGKTRLADETNPQASVNRRIDLRFIMESPRAEDLDPGPPSSPTARESVERRYLE